MMPLPVSPPEISVVVFMPHHFSWLAPLLRALHAQTASGRIELIVVVQSLSTFGAGDEVIHGFNRAIVVESSEADSHITAKIVGLRSATAPIVAFAEDHCFPEPDWADRLMRAHESDCAAVGPSMKNGNPNSALSRALFALHWGQWAHPVEGGDVSSLPPHNTSYKRSVLLPLLDELHDLVAVEQFLHFRIREAGHRIAIEPAAVVHHCNISKLRPWCRISYLGGRLYGAYRVKRERLTFSQRMIRTLTSPLVPAVRLTREMPYILRTAGSTADLTATIAMAAMHLILHTAGEAVGYVAGGGDSEAACADLETSRFRDMREADLRGLRTSASIRMLDPVGLAS